VTGDGASATERVAAIVPAAGRGERLGPGTPKALRLLGGVPLLVHAVRSLAAARLVDLVVVAAPAGQVGEVQALLADHHAGAVLQVVEGGPTRRDSVRAALPDTVGIVLVHDAARPLAPVELADAVVAAVRAGADAVVPGLPVTDTVKRVDGDVVVETVDRSALRAVQTPQGFNRAVLEEAHLTALGTDDGEVTDDAGLVEQAGHQVVVVTGAEEAFKVTRPLDLLLAEAVLTRRRAGGGGGVR
jgi:2-C-methyl-D-erythritol 4-phosphate cytidylyltransferase